MIVYEGDWEGAAAARGRGGAASSLEDVRLEEDEENESDQIEVEVDEQGEIVMESIPDNTSETSSLGTGAKPRLYTIALIDFAHTRVVPGEGPDSGVLKGMDTLITLIARRTEEVAAFMQVGESGD